MKIDSEKTAAVILAAGKGTRLNSKEKNKVVLPLAGKPMIEWTVERLNGAGIKKVVVVVGFAEETVRKALGNSVEYAVQEEILGTGHAPRYALKKLDKQYRRVMVLYGDHSAFYTSEFYERLVERHRSEGNAMTLVSVRKDPKEYAWGRVVRNGDGSVRAIVEEKDCTEQQKKIDELNAGCYVFERGVLEEALPKLNMNELKGEYYLTDVAEYCVKNGLRVGAFEASEEEVGIGVNTKEQRDEARRAFDRLVK